MVDILLQECIKKEYWEEALQSGVTKGIPKRILKDLSEPEYRMELFESIIKGEYEIAPPRTQKIPKDKPGEFRTVYINDGQDRILLRVITNALFALTPNWISKHCTSYQKGIGTGKVVERVSKWITDGEDNEVGRKADLSKYFDSVPIKYIDKIYDWFECEFNKSCMITLARKYYHQDTCWVNGKLVTHYQSLKQGCAIASWLANVLLYDLDEEMNKICNGQYVRYSDDMLFICDNYDFAEQYLRTRLSSYGLTLNPKKVEPVYKNKWVTFLGFSIKGDKISLSKNRLNKFKTEIKNICLKHGISYTKAIRKVIRFLYIGNGDYSWATSILPVVNCESDLEMINQFVMDCLRATVTNRKNIAGVGYEPHEDGVVIYRPCSHKVFTLPDGTEVKSRYGDSSHNRKVVEEIEGYYSISCMWNAIQINKGLYSTNVREMMIEFGIS